jgi:hypothetical protein
MRVESPTLRMSIVVCAHTSERWDDIRAAVESLREQTCRPAEVILVIDHNPDLLARAEASFPDVRTAPNTGTRGLSGARNTGVVEATATRWMRTRRRPNSTSTTSRRRSVQNSRWRPPVSARSARTSSVGSSSATIGW